MTSFLLSFLLLASDPVGDLNLIEMLRDAQATNQSGLREGSVIVRLSIEQEGMSIPAKIEYEVTWSEEKSWTKFKLSDPLAVKFPKAEKEWGDDWYYVLKTRDFIEIYNTRDNLHFSRSPEPGEFDDIFDANPWFHASHCCSPGPFPPDGQSWRELIGPHPALPMVQATSRFAYERLKNGDIKQVRKDEDGINSQITFSSEYNYSIISSFVFDSDGLELSSVLYKYRKEGKIVLPVECVALPTAKDRNNRKKFVYHYSNWDVFKPLPRDTFTASRFKRFVAQLRSTQRRPAPPGMPRISEERLRELSKKMRENGFARP